MTSAAKTKPNNVDKQEVLKAWKRVRANKGAPGVDNESISKFEEKLSKNLYKLWNRMNSGSYFPQAVMRKEIPKKDGSTRPLGIPTVYDRIAQEVVKARLEPILEPHFHEDSYGYRPGKSAIDAISVCRERNWKYDWILDIDIEKFFDTVSHALLLKAVSKHCNEKWMVLYIKRWLEAPIQHLDGRIEESKQGTPQGGVISPLLANLYLHYAFDKWMEREFPEVKFERYADDIICHCKSKVEVDLLLQELEKRLKECNLKLHPDKTKIVYCRDSNRNEDYENISFNFLGYTFRPRKAKSSRTGKGFTSFLPAASREAQKNLRMTLKRQCALKHSQLNVNQVANAINAQLRGWINYFKPFSKGRLSNIYLYIENKIIKWAKRKYRFNIGQSYKWLIRTKTTQPKLFAHWELLGYIKVGIGRAV